jgi:hypothetical protein
MAFYQFQKSQIVNASTEELWDFISSPQNLEKITPKHMEFNIQTPNLPDKIYEEMIICILFAFCQVFRPNGLPKSHILEINPILLTSKEWGLINYGIINTSISLKKMAR